MNSLNALKSKLTIFKTLKIVVFIAIVKDLGIEVKEWARDDMERVGCSFLQEKVMKENFKED